MRYCASSDGLSTVRLCMRVIGIAAATPWSCHYWSTYICIGCTVRSTYCICLRLLISLYTIVGGYNPPSTNSTCDIYTYIRMFSGQVQHNRHTTLPLPNTRTLSIHQSINPFPALHIIVRVLVPAMSSPLKKHPPS